MAYADRVFDALGDPTRRTVFKRLQNGARSVTEIADGMDVSRPAVSQHLAVLKAARLVTDRAEGTRRLYAVDPTGMREVDAWLEQFRGFWNQRLDALGTEIARGKRR